MAISFPVWGFYLIGLIGVILSVALIGWLWYGQSLDAPALVGLGLIIAGVAVVNLLSSSISH